MGPIEDVPEEPAKTPKETLVEIAVTEDIVMEDVEEGTLDTVSEDIPFEEEAPKREANRVSNPNIKPRPGRPVEFGEECPVCDLHVTENLLDHLKLHMNEKVRFSYDSWSHIYNVLFTIIPETPLSTSIGLPDC